MPRVDRTARQLIRLRPVLTCHPALSGRLTKPFNRRTQPDVAGARGTRTRIGPSQRPHLLQWLTRRLRIVVRIVAVLSVPPLYQAKADYMYTRYTERAKRMAS